MTKKIAIVLISFIAAHAMAATKSPFVAECSVNTASAELAHENSKAATGRPATLVKGGEPASATPASTALKTRTASASHATGCDLTK
jgi:hypothetical protein